MMMFFHTSAVMPVVLALWTPAGAGDAARGKGTSAFAVDAGARGKVIRNKFGDINQWVIDTIWLDKAEQYPNDFFKKNYPFVERVLLFAATGGNEDRDLFKDPLDRTTVTDYDASRLIHACENIVAKGLKPVIKTGWVPAKMSDSPENSRDFHTNLRPPKDYEAYYNYIRATAEALKEHFGIKELRTWTWGVGVECDYDDWFNTADNSRETSKQEFFKVYDYTVAALEDALGPRNFRVGAHSASVGDLPANCWDARDLLEHCARGVNAKTGKSGTKLDFMAISSYTWYPGFDADQLVGRISRLREKAEEVGLKNLRFEVNEGRVLFGWDKKFINLNEVQHPVQAACDAKLFRVLLDNDIDSQSFWCVSTDYVTELEPMRNRITLFNWFGGIPVLSANLRSLAFRMTGSARLGVSKSGQPADSSDEVDLVAGYDEKQKTLRILAYNFNPTQDASTDESLDISVRNLLPLAGKQVVVRTWRLDEDHGNWWKQWEADAARRGLTADSFVGSKYTPALPGDLANRADMAYWDSREGFYRRLGELKHEDETASVSSDGCLTLHAVLKPHGVSLIEVAPAEMTAHES